MIFTFPLSIRLMSRISLIRDSRCSLEVEILARYSFTFSWLSTWEAAREVNPMMAFMGVRISWDMLFRNVVLAELALSARSKAASSS